MKRLSGLRITAFVTCLALALPLLAHEGASEAAIGFNEKLGAHADIDAPFTAGDGKPVTLRELGGRPILLALSFYRCKDQCNTLLVGLAKAVRDLEGQPGKDWRVVTVSINPLETPAEAVKEQAIVAATIGKPFPSEAWPFLVGDHDSIDRLADSVGFSYRKVGDEFDHPLGLVMLSPEGTIVRYIQGPEFLPIDLGMAVMESSKGLVRPTVAKMLRLCLTYDSRKKQYGFDFLRVAGLLSLLVAVALAAFLVIAGPKRRAANLARSGKAHEGSRDPRGPEDTRLPSKDRPDEGGG
ncbi:MAG: SCO family protein [Spirochaetota bacterium]